MRVLCGTILMMMALGAAGAGWTPGSEYAGGSSVRTNSVYDPFLGNLLPQNQNVSIVGRINTNDFAIFTDRSGRFVRGTNLIGQVQGWAQEATTGAVAQAEAAHTAATNAQATADVAYGWGNHALAGYLLATAVSNIANYAAALVTPTSLGVLTAAQTTNAADNAVAISKVKRLYEDPGTNYVAVTGSNLVLYASSGTEYFKLTFTGVYNALLVGQPWASPYTVSSDGNTSNNWTISINKLPGYASYSFVRSLQGDDSWRNSVYPSDFPLTLTSTDGGYGSILIERVLANSYKTFASLADLAALSNALAGATSGVPYTGATTNVNLGAYALTASSLTSMRHKSEGTSMDFYVMGSIRAMLEVNGLYSATRFAVLSTNQTEIPITTVLTGRCPNLNADMLDGYHATNLPYLSPAGDGSQLTGITAGQVGSVDSNYVSAVVASNTPPRAWMPLTTQSQFGYVDLTCASNSTINIGPAPLNSFVIRPLILQAINSSGWIYSNIVFYCDRSTSDPRAPQGFNSATTGVFTISNWGLPSPKGFVMRRNDSFFTPGNSRKNIAAYSLGIAGTSIRLMCLWSPATDTELADADGIIDYGNDAR